MIWGRGGTYASDESNDLGPLSLNSSPETARTSLLDLDLCDALATVRMVGRVGYSRASYGPELPRCCEADGRGGSIVEEEDEAVKPA